MFKFVDFSYEINKKPWCDGGDIHVDTWCNGACKVLNLLKPIKDYFNQNIPIEQQKKNFIVHSLIYKDIFEELYKIFI